jgi:dienelactone hydrolase
MTRIRRFGPVPSSLILCLCLLACTPRPAALDNHDPLLTVPVANADGSVTDIPIRICRPAQGEPAPLVVINHGSPGVRSLRAQMQPESCSSEAAHWFLARFYIVAFPLRRGYGPAGGSWPEDYGACDAPDYFHAGLESVRDIDAAVEVLTRLPYVRPDNVVIVGYSAGGWGTIAYDSVAHPKVSAFVVMAAGRGGHKDGVNNRNCRPDAMIAAAGRYGATATTPMLWIYAQNDSFFDPALAAAMHQAFTAAGGQAQLEQPAAYGEDGHAMFQGANGSAIWGPMVEHYLNGQPAGKMPAP